MVRLPNELILWIIERSMAYEKGPERGQQPRLTDASVKTILTFRTVNRAFASFSSDFFSEILQERTVKLIEADLDMLEVITRDTNICQRMHTLTLSTAFPIRGLLGTWNTWDGTVELPLEVMTAIFEYSDLAETHWHFYLMSIERLAAIIRRLSKLEEVVIREGSECVLPTPMPMPWKEQLTAYIERALSRHEEDVKGFRDIQAIYAILKALTEAESTPQRVKIASLPIAAGGFDAFRSLARGLPSVTSLDITLFIAKRFNGHRHDMQAVMDNDAQSIRSVFTIFPRVTDLHLNTIPGDKRAYAIFRHADAFWHNPVPFFFRPACPVHNLTTLELGIHLRRGFRFFDRFSALICRSRRTLRHVALYTVEFDPRRRLGIRHYIQPMLIESLRLETFYLQLAHQAIDARDLRYLPLPLNRFAKRVFVRHLPKQYQGIPRDVIWSDWAGPDGGDGYFAGDFELWFHDAGNKEQNDIWLPSEL